VYWLFGQDQQGWGVFMILWGLVVTVIDNFIKPLLIGVGVAMPMSLTILGVFGGFVAFGFLGLFIGPTLIRRTGGATELRRTFWISLGAVVPLFFGHLAQVGLWAGALVLLGALQTYDDAFYFSLVTFATLGYGDIVLTPGYRIFGALAATCGSLMLGWSTALIFAAISRAVDRGRA
jgi:hypothetical protein